MDFIASKTDLLMEVNNMSRKPLTLEETFELLGIKANPWQIQRMAKETLPETTGELDWLYKRVEVRERESGVPELAIYIPFKVEGL